MANQRTIYTLRVGDYAPRIWQLTRPLLQHYADKIGAEFVVIDQPNPDWSQWPITINKFQVAKLAKERKDEWAIFLDADTLVNPECPDFTNYIPRDTVAHNGIDHSGVRWDTSGDEYMRRDGRWIGSCTWCVFASDWTVEDLWRMPDQAPGEVFGVKDDKGGYSTRPKIYTTNQEHNSGQCHTEHLIDDYTLSRNIARFGLKVTTLIDVCGALKWKQPDGRGFNPFLHHLYTLTEEQKLNRMLNVLSTPIGMAVMDPQTKQPMDPGWGLMDPAYATKLRMEWGIV